MRNWDDILFGLIWLDFKGSQVFCKACLGEKRLDRRVFEPEKVLCEGIEGGFDETFAENRIGGIEYERSRMKALKLDVLKLGVGTNTGGFEGRFNGGDFGMI